MTDTRFQKYRRSQLVDLRPFEEGEQLDGVDVQDGESPKLGDYVGRIGEEGPFFLLTAEDFAASYAPIDLSELDDQRATVLALERELRTERERLAHLEAEAAAR